MNRPRAFPDDAGGVAAVEFAFIAPILIAGVLATADIGLSVHERFEIDETLRNGAEAALADPGESVVAAVLLATDSAGSETTWTVERYCACPEASGERTSCGATCSGEAPTSIYYALSGARAFSAVVLPSSILERSSLVQVR